MCPKGMLGHLELEDRKPDLAAARALLAEAGFPDGFETELWHGDVQRAYLPDPDGVAIQIQQDLKEIGIRARIKKVEWSAYIPATQRGEHPMCLLGWTTDNGDPDNFLWQLLHRENAVKGEAQNVSFYRNEEVSDLLDRAQHEVDAKKRRELYARAQVLIHEHCPMVPLLYLPQMVAYRNEVQGYRVHPIGIVRLAPVNIGRK